MTKMYHDLVALAEKEIGSRAANLALMEVGLGSILHAWRVPFAGHFLSLNQAAVLASGLEGHTKIQALRATLQISAIAALLKTLSPAGKKLTPMLALSMQGFFYALGIFFFGANRIGAVVGGIFLSLWAFLQPLLLYALLFGASGLTVLDFYIQKLAPYTHLSAQTLFFILALGIFGKALLAAGLCFFAYKHPYRIPFAYTPKPMRANMSLLRKVVRSALKPSFILPILLTIIFLIWSNTNTPAALLFVLRPLALGFALLIFVELFPWEKLSWIQAKWPGFTQALAHAREEIKRSRS